MEKRSQILSHKKKTLTTFEKLRLRLATKTKNAFRYVKKYEIPCGLEACSKLAYKDSSEEGREKTSLEGALLLHAPYLLPPEHHSNVCLCLDPVNHSPHTNQSPRHFLSLSPLTLLPPFSPHSLPPSSTPRSSSICLQ